MRWLFAAALGVVVAATGHGAPAAAGPSAAAPSAAAPSAAPPEAAAPEDERKAWWDAARDKAGRYPIRTRLVDAGGRPRHVNALILEHSPYLLLHAHDPIRWRAWSPDALGRAQRENRLIFLSIGYSSCHWCHVMAREAFDDEEIARLLNWSFVSIKVDREEYPDLDDRYLKRLALLTGSAGWPANLVLTPTGEVVAGDTYLPPQRLADLLTRFAEAWRRRPDQVKRLATTVESQFKPRAPGPAVDAAGLRARALAAVRRQYDPTHHGFGTAPKFPNAAYLAALLDAYRRDGGADDRRMVVDTLRAIVASALHDDVGGGFFRYSVEPDWQRPHFEKTLYDQALLVPLLAEAWTLTGEAIFVRAAERTLAFVERAMRTPGGLYASALDADADGRDGGHYLWTTADLDALGPTDRAAIDSAYRRVDQGDGSFLLVPRPDVAVERLDSVAATLRAVRERRPRPFVDAKAITGWNALMIEALARAGRLFGDPRSVASAAATMRKLLALNTGVGRVYRYSIDGQGHLDASVEDLAYLLRALAALHEIEGNAFWLSEADRVAGALAAEVALAEQLRSGSHDRALPSPGAALADALDRLARQTGSARHRDAAASVAAHLRRAVDVDAGDQTTLATGLYALERPAPTRTAFLADGHVRAEITRVVRDGDATRLDVTLRIDPSWHVNGPKPRQPALIPTRIEGEGGAAVEVTYPPSKEVTLRFADGPVDVYDGTVTLGVRITGADAPPVVKLSLQACSDRLCLLPETVRLFR